MEYESTIKTIWLLSHVKTWKDVKYTLLTERRHPEKTTYSFVPTMYLIGEGKIMETVKRLVVCQGFIKR